MKIQHLIILFGFTLFSQLSWAPPTIKPQDTKDKEKMSEYLSKPEEGESPRGAVGGATSLGFDLSKCQIDPRKQRKTRFRGKDGKEHHVCTGEAVCGGKKALVSCKISERESCPTAEQCSPINNPITSDPRVVILIPLGPNQKLTYSVSLDTTRSKGPFSPRTAFTLQIVYRDGTIYQEPQLVWNEPKVYKITNKDITDKMRVHGNAKYIKIFYSYDIYRTPFNNMEVTLFIDGEPVARKNFGFQIPTPRPMPPRPREIPDPFPPFPNELGFPREDTQTRQDLSDPIAIMSEVIIVHFQLSN